MITIRPSDERGSVNHGWLHAKHSFSFGSYHDAEHMGVSALRVINDDHIEPGQGFPTHSHQDMEIITYVTHGRIEHKDSMGNTEVLPAGEFQLMSAGSGITHSEYNPSSNDALKLFQIWIEPNQLGIEPGYQQKKFKPKHGLQLIASPDARDGSFLMHQDAYLSRLQLDAGQSISYPLATDRTLYIHIIKGELNIGDENLFAGDAVTITDITQLELNSLQDTEALIFDLP